MRLQTELYSRLTLMAALREFPKSFANLLESGLHTEAGRLASGMGVMTAIYASHLWHGLEADEESGLRICASMVANQDLLFERLNQNPHQEAFWGKNLLAAKDFLIEQEFANLLSLPTSLGLSVDKDAYISLQSTFRLPQSKPFNRMLANAYQFDALAHTFWMVSAQELLIGENTIEAYKPLAACLLLWADTIHQIDSSLAKGCLAHIEEVARTLILPQMMPFLFEEVG